MLGSGLRVLLTLQKPQSRGCIGCCSSLKSTSNTHAQFVGGFDCGTAYAADLHVALELHEQCTHRPIL